MRKVKQYNLAFCDEHGCYDEGFLSGGIQISLIIYMS